MVKKKKKKNPGNTPSVLTEEKVVDLIEKKVEQRGANLSEEERKMHVEALKKVFFEGALPREAIGISDDIMNLLYNQAYTLYNLGQYKEANQIFYFLTTMEPTASNYHMGLAATHHKMGEYDSAAKAYFAVATLDVLSPVPFYHLADIYLHTEEPKAAYAVLKTAITRCGDDSTYSKLKGRCYAMMEKIKSDLGVNEEEEK